MDVTSLQELLKTQSVSKKDFLKAYQNIQKNEKYADDSIFSSQNATISDINKIFDSLDVNGDGKIDTADKLGETDISNDLISDDDLDLFVDELENMYDEEVAPEVESSNHSSGSYGGGDTYSDSNDDNSKDSNNYANMSIDELKSELTTAQSTLTTEQNGLNQIIDGSNPILQGLQQDIDTAENEYQQALQTIAPELADKYKSAKDEVDQNKQNIADKEVAINDKESVIENLNGTISDLDGQISSCESGIANLRAAMSSSADTSDLSSKISALESKKSQLEQQKKQKETELNNAENELSELNSQLTELKSSLTEKETTLQTIQTEINNLNNTELNTLKDNVVSAQNKYDSQQSTLKTEAESKIATAKANVQAIQSEIQTKSIKEIQRESSTFNLNNAQELYNAMGLEEKGLNFEVFALAIEGYNNLDDKGNGYLGIFDTTQSDNSDRYYLLDLNNFELVGQSQMKTGSGNMSNIETANKYNSHATLSGFERVGAEYYSSKMGKQALRLIGLEKGINDNALGKGTVVHYTTGNHTWGCLGFPPVKKNGRIDKEATYQKMRELFPTDTIVFTYPKDKRYKEMSSLYT